MSVPGMPYNEPRPITRHQYHATSLGRYAMSVPGWKYDGPGSGVFKSKSFLAHSTQKVHKAY
eukprot:772269-Rhodomonas_salina.2